MLLTWAVTLLLFSSAFCADGTYLRHRRAAKSNALRVDRVYKNIKASLVLGARSPVLIQNLTRVQDKSLNVGDAITLGQDLWNCGRSIKNQDDWFTDCLGILIDLAEAVSNDCINMMLDTFRFIFNRIQSDKDSYDICSEVITFSTNMATDVFGCALFLATDGASDLFKESSSIPALYKFGDWFHVDFSDVALAIPAGLAAWAGCTKADTSGGNDYPSYDGLECNALTWNEKCCTEQNKCGVAQGHCASDNHCKGDLVCGNDNCNYYDSRFAPGTNCCKRKAGSSKNCYEKIYSWWSSGCCKPDKKCGLHQGACKKDSDCEDGLYCGYKNSKSEAGWKYKVNVCTRHPNGSPLNHAWSGACLSFRKCDEGFGDCDRDSHCKRGLKCGRDNCGSNYPKGYDCCERKISPSLCSKNEKCSEGYGDCDGDNQCQEGLRCGDNNCGPKYPQGLGYDCCERKP